MATIQNPNPADPYIQGLISQGWRFDASTNTLTDVPVAAPVPLMGSAPPPPVDWVGLGIPAPGTGGGVTQYTPTQYGGSPVTAEYYASQGLLATQQQQLAAQQQQLQLQQLKLLSDTQMRAYEQDVINAQRAQIGAQGNVTAAQKNQLAATKTYLSEQERVAQERFKEQQEIVAAKNDPQDLLRVARIKRDRQNYAYRYSIAGLEQPVEVDLPEGYQGPLPPGIVQRVQALAEILTEAAQDKDTIRQYRLELLRIKAARLGIAVDEANLIEDEFGRRVNEAQLRLAEQKMAQEYGIGVQLAEAELAASRAGLAVSQARLDLARSTMPPGPGLTWDELSSQWLTAQQLEDLKLLRAEQEKARAVQLGGDLGPFSENDLVNMLANDVLNEDQVRGELSRRGFLPGTIETFVNLANSRRDTSESSDLSGAFGGSILTGGGTAGSNTYQPVTPLTAARASNFFNR